MTTAENAEWVDGPGLCHWLQRNGHVPKGQVTQIFPPNMRRRWSAWKAGATASFYLVEEMLILLELHPTMLPEELFVEPRGGRPKGKKNLSEREIAKVRAKIKTTASAQEVAQEFEISTRYVRHLRQAMREKRQGVLSRE